MRLTVCCVSRNKSIYVTTLHTLLQLTAHAVQNGHQINILFAADMNDLPKLFKSCERILWINYGSSLDIASFPNVFKKCEVGVFPAVLEGVEWEQFRTSVKSNTNEPLHQVGMKFDTTVDKKIEDGVWTVSESSPSIWVADCAKVLEKVKGRKGEGLKLPNTTPELFKRFKDCDVRCIAYTKAEVLMHYSHECIGALLETAGVSCQKVD